MPKSKGKRHRWVYASGGRWGAECADCGTRLKLADGPADAVLYRLAGSPTWTKGYAPTPCAAAKKGASA